MLVTKPQLRGWDHNSRTHYLFEEMICSINFYIILPSVESDVYSSDEFCGHLLCYIKYHCLIRRKRRGIQSTTSRLYSANI